MKVTLHTFNVWWCFNNHTVARRVQIHAHTPNKHETEGNLQKKCASVKTLIPGCHVGRKTPALGLLYSVLIGQSHQQNPIFIMKGVCVLHGYSTIVLQKSIHRRGYLVSEWHMQNTQESIRAKLSLLITSGQQRRKVRGTFHLLAWVVFQVDTFCLLECQPTF